MVSLCKHDGYKVIDTIWEPRYHDMKVLINANFITPNIDHYFIRFTKAPAYPDWYLFSGKDIRKAPVQKNGNGRMYVVDFNKRQEHQLRKECEHVY